MIYLFDSNFAFNQNFISRKDPEKNEILMREFKEYIDKNGLNNVVDNTPLVGYAIEFPSIKNDPGGTYLQGDYELDIDEEASNEIDDELDGINDIREI